MVREVDPRAATKTHDRQMNKYFKKRKKQSWVKGWRVFEEPFGLWGQGLWSGLSGASKPTAPGGEEAEDAWPLLEDSLLRAGRRGREEGQEVGQAGDPEDSGWALLYQLLSDLGEAIFFLCELQFSHLSSGENYDHIVFFSS